MAAATLVATAFGIIIIIVTAYVLAGGTLLTSEVVINAQKDTTDLQVKMLGTSMTVLSHTSGGSPLYIELQNTGREPIRDFQYIDVYLHDPINGWSLFPYKNTTADGYWTKIIITDGDHLTEKIYPNQWDPDEILNISVSYSTITPDYYKIVTGNGVTNF
ncbi:MAG: hypothetical protein A4E42_01226 [Methanoregulaceae archaeon PtaU1.Bin222]|nr:MAG: hypothetical protein A4E42_01226 [Methanoregulaceae archaeon PtaU1.Bin222]